VALQLSFKEDGMGTTRRAFYCAFACALAAWFTGISSAALSAETPPSSGQVAFAQEVSDLMVNELVAALFKEFDETTPQNVPHGEQAISLIFNDLNRNMRLIGRFAPLLGGRNDRPSDNFERTALERALNGGQASTAVQKVNDTWFYRRHFSPARTTRGSGSARSSWQSRLPRATTSGSRDAGPV
jgi:hypothetical protein